MGWERKSKGREIVGRDEVQDNKKRCRTLVSILLSIRLLLSLPFLLLLLLLLVVSVNVLKPLFLSIPFRFLCCFLPLNQYLPFYIHTQVFSTLMIITSLDTHHRHTYIPTYINTYIHTYTHTKPHTAAQCISHITHETNQTNQKARREVSIFFIGCWECLVVT